MVAAFSALLRALLVGGAWAQTFCGRNGMYTCGTAGGLAGQTIAARKLCDGVNDCTTTAGSQAKAKPGANGVDLADDERNCGGLADLIVGGAVAGIQMSGSRITISSDPDAPAGTLGIYEVGYTGEPASWTAASTASSSYQWSFARCNQQGLPNCARQDQATCNYYRDDPHIEGAFQIVLKTTAQKLDVRYDLRPVDVNGNILATATNSSCPATYTASECSYWSRYGRAPPKLCTGDLLDQCLTGKMDLDVAANDCVCGSYQTDTELNADFRFVPPSGFTGTIKFEYIVAQASWTPSTGRDNICSGRGGGGSCSEQDANTGYIPVTLVFKEFECAGIPGYCGSHGTCMAPGGCECEDGWMGDKCDMARSSALGLGPSAVSATIAIVVMAMW